MKQHNRLYYFVIGYIAIAAVLSGCAIVEKPAASLTPSPATTHHPINGNNDDTSSPVRVPTPLSVPELVHAMQQQNLVGNHTQTAYYANELLDAYPTVLETHIAHYYLAVSFAQRRRWASAVETFVELIDNTTNDDLAHDVIATNALFWLARGYEELGDWAQAAATYQRYRELHTPLEPYAAIRQAAQYHIMGAYEDAAQGYVYGGSTNINPSERAGSLEKAIAIYRDERGNPTKALELYETLLQFARIPEYRARVLLDAAALADAQAHHERARTWLHECITVAPNTPQAVSAAEQLIAAGDSSLTLYTAATVFFHAELYSLALQFYDEALAEQPAPQPGIPPDEATLAIQRERGITLQALGMLDDAQDALMAVVTANPDSNTGRQARLDWIQTLGQQGATEEAITHYRNYADTYPDDARAPEALDRAAQLLDRIGNSAEALAVRVQLEQRYPTQQTTPAPLHGAALAAFQAERYADATVLWQQIATDRSGTTQAQSLYWLARSAQAQGDSDGNADTLFARAYEASPESYYGARASENHVIPQHNAPYQLDAMLLDGHNNGTDSDEAEWHTVTDWVTTWVGNTTTLTNTPQTPPVDVAHHAVVQRAIALHEVGLFTEAYNEWLYAIDIWHDDALNLVLLARAAHEHNAPSIALKAAERVVQLADVAASIHAGAVPPPPPLLTRLRFPTPYADLVVREATTWHIDPRLLYALMRQESLFRADARSWVGALGLCQIMPTTGDAIARQLQLPDVSTEDIMVPYINIRMGAYYIAQQITTMEGSIHAGLAAYNGGPGNAQRWAGDSTHVADADLFTETIDYPETENYVKRVYGNYGVYQRLYAWTEQDE